MFQVRLTGLDAMAQKLNAKPEKLKTEGAKTVRKLSVIGMKAAQMKAPIRTGALVRSIQLLPITSGGTISGGFGSNLVYAAAVNYGHQAYGRGKWIEGAFFMDAGYEAIEQMADREVQAMLKRIMKG